jgi:hypothetical protein
MILQGHIQPIWHREDYRGADYTLGIREEMCKRLVLSDNNDHHRYSDQQFSMWYHDSNTAMYQFLPAHEFAWLDEKGISLHRTPPGHIIPSHRDEYRAYRARFNITDVNKIVRAVIFLEDWQPGHYLGVADRGFASWRAGDWVAWFGSVPHTVANLGSEDRYTMTVTGISQL